jgi:predicted RNA-binding Zn-ribbon protein involved in translation (DUF1610 family)
METYKVIISCSNCGLSKVEIEIPKGTPVNEAPCPQCGNATLVRIRNVAL